jgi:hypothetical protein
MKLQENLFCVLLILVYPPLIGPANLCSLHSLLIVILQNVLFLAAFISLSLLIFLSV